MVFITLGVPKEFVETPINRGIIPLAFHSLRSPSALNPVGAFNAIVGMPRAVLPTGEVIAATLLLLPAASLTTTA